MATDHPIAPFPGHIDRDTFGQWFSGFTDGEGCFYLGVHQRPECLAPVARFSVALRADEHPVLRLIHSYFRVGSVWVHRSPKTRTPRQRPKCDFTVNRICDLARVIVPHFDRYPLFAKKRNDYLIWREAVLYAASILPPKRRSGTGGFRPSWSLASIDRFREYRDALRSVREYTETPGGVCPLILGTVPVQPGLFDAVSEAK